MNQGLIIATPIPEKSFSLPKRGRGQEAGGRR